jgi:mRNA interferase RelE/StbE
MALYKVYFRVVVDKELEKIPKKDQIKILERINKLSTNPRPIGYEKLKGSKYYRVRQGDYRIIYEIHDKELVVWIIKVDNRKDVYRISEEKAEYTAGNKAGKSVRSKTGKTKRLP